MKGLNLATVVFGLTCLSIYAYPVWNEQKNCIEDRVSDFDYNSMKDSSLFEKLVRGDKSLLEKLRNLPRNMDDDVLNFLGEVQNLSNLTETIKVSGLLAGKDILGCNEISAPTAIYIYQIMFSDPAESDDENIDNNVANEAFGRNFDEYIKGMIGGPFSNDFERF